MHQLIVEMSKPENASKSASEVLGLAQAATGPLPSTVLRAAINTLVHKAHAIRTDGPAPRGGLEREIQEIIDAD